MELILASLVVIFAACIQACTGFGFSVLATPLLLFIFDPTDAIQINIALSIIISVLLVPKLVTDVDKPLFGRLFLGSLLGAPVGILIYIFANPELLRLTIGVFLLIFTGLLLCNFSLLHSRSRDLWTGGFSGALTSGLGMPGPPLMVYFAGATREPSILRSTTLIFFLVTYSIGLILQIAVGSLSYDVLRMVLLLAPATVAGVIIGQAIFVHINPSNFMRLIHFLLFFTGSYLVIGYLL